MRADVEVLTQEKFDAWVEDQLASVSDDPVIRGQSFS